MNNPIPCNQQLQRPGGPVYLPGLNGLRAIAALAVVISHITLGLGQFGLNSKIFGVDREGRASGLLMASYGVTIFFTLSGFLITFLLLKEKEGGSINIKNFYIRRVLRIWPLYYLYFLLCIAVIIFFGLSINSGMIPFYVFLMANIPFILGKTLPFLAHYWSLGVEEQFYLFFPRLAKLTNRKLLKTAWILVVVLFVIKLLFWLIMRTSGFELAYGAIDVTGFHIMLIGVAGAILYYQQHPLFVAVTTHRLTQVVAWLCVLGMVVNKFHIASVIDTELVALIALCLIMGQVTKRNCIIDLENKFCDFIGRISYGIYVIHPLLIFLLAKITGRFEQQGVLNYLFVYLLIIAVTICLAWLSFEYYERRFLKLRARYATVQSTNIKIANNKNNPNIAPSYTYKQ